ncbi:DEAD/DEAH box helicase [Marinomonas spartinae]|uniref:DEAD/DEAH box helicase n=1 Tax=Marinomonas spartinae TaxID=1792290 RepID=UPI0011126273|nr:DEAD/DEAH box helicase [Marinomonas spartinae]
MLCRKHVRVLILAPLRELAIQVEACIALYAKYANLTSIAVYGGVDTNLQK